MDVKLNLNFRRISILAKGAVLPVDFWKRWHMTLTRFPSASYIFPGWAAAERDCAHHVNAAPEASGQRLWHGANWTFILWGLIHGAAQCLNRMFDRQWNRLHTAFRWMATFLFVNLSWVIFRADSISQAKQFLRDWVGFENMQINWVCRQL